MGIFGNNKKTKRAAKAVKLLLKMADKGQRPFCSAVIVAAGSASRMEGVDKIFAKLHGITVLERAVAPFAASKAVDEIVVVVREEALPHAEMLLRWKKSKKPVTIVKGGATRWESVLNGLNACSPKAKLAAVHDGARPLVTVDIVEEAIGKAASTGAAAPAVAVKDTIKVAEYGRVCYTPERKSLFAVQTPQVFAMELLRAGILTAKEKQLPITDDCSAVEEIGVTVHLTEGDYENLKITTPEDLWLAESILTRRAQP